MYDGLTWEELAQEFLQREKEILEEFGASVYLDASILRQFGIDLYFDMDKLAAETVDYDPCEWQRECEREARPREQARALARYKAHCTRMTAHKARQQLRRRKYRGGANAGWY